MEMRGREQTSAREGGQGKGDDDGATATALQNARCGLPEPGLTRRCRLHPPCPRLLAARSTSPRA
ncbi:hypothetical protein GEV49_01715 [Streptomyces sp. SYP-A7193]|nr:hypothetical protein GEV49_01715 [Streptomyces sp. SYP-A7193]